MLSVPDAVQQAGERTARLGFPGWAVQNRAGKWQMDVQVGYIRIHVDTFSFFDPQLFLKLTLSMIISTDKSECDNGRFDCPTEDESAQQRLADCVDTGVQTDDPSESSECEDFAEDQFFDCREDFNETASVKPSTEELLNRLLDTSQDATSTSSQLSLRLTVYTCILGCFLQLSALAYLLNVATSIPPGLVFLISSLVYIGYVMMRVSHNKLSAPDVVDSGCIS